MKVHLVFIPNTRGTKSFRRAFHVQSEAQKYATHLDGEVVSKDLDDLPPVLKLRVMAQLGEDRPLDKAFKKMGLK